MDEPDHVPGEPLAGAVGAHGQPLGPGREREKEEGGQGGEAAHAESVRRSLSM